MSIQKSKPNIYIAGPMTGYPQFNFPAFDQLARLAEKDERFGVVYNPADLDRMVWPDIETWEGFADGDPARCPNFDLARAMRRNVRQITQSDEMWLLEGWEHSKGAQIERYVAEQLGVVCHLAFWTAVEGTQTRATKLDEIQKRMVGRMRFDRGLM